MTNSDATSSWDFTYDANGLRTGRTDYYNTYMYYRYQYDSSGRLVYMDSYNGAFSFTYDPVTGFPLSLTCGDGTYYYVTNSRGDVLGITDSEGNLCLAYEYDAWGNVINYEGYSSLYYISYNPLLYRGYIYDWETGLYYLQSRYYDPEIGRFINADDVDYLGVGVNLTSYNLFAYCGNNPIAFKDPSGNIAIAITTVIFVGSVLVGVFAAGYTAGVEYRAGFGTGRIIGDSICAGFAAFSIVYTGGMSLYQCYQNYCYLNAITPATHIGSTPSPSQQLQACADSANATVPGKGPVAGTKKHSEFAKNVNNLGRSDLATEISYKDGAVVPYGTQGSVRFDAIQYNRHGIPIAAWDLKTGAATLAQSRIIEMQSKSGLSIPVYCVR